jgi:hypothetical protein
MYLRTSRATKPLCFDKVHARFHLNCPLKTIMKQHFLSNSESGWRTSEGSMECVLAKKHLSYGFALGFEVAGLA